MKSTRTLHSTSDRLEDRYPYDVNDPKNKAHFAKEIPKDQVSLAFGRLGIERLIQLLLNEKLEDEKKITSLEYMIDSTKSHENKYQAVQQGALQACTNLLQNPCHEIRSLAAKTIGSLFCIQAAQIKAKDIHCIPLLVQLLSDPYENVRSNAAQSIACYVANPSSASEFSKNTSLVENLVNCIPDQESIQVNIHTLRALEYISTNAQGVHACLQASCEKKLVQMTALSYLQTSIAQTAWNLASYPQGTRQVIDAGLIPVLSDMLASTNDHELKTLAAGALLAASIEKNGKMQIGQFSAKALCDNLVLSRTNKPTPLEINISETIKSACELEHVREIFVTHLLGPKNQALQQVFGVTCAPTLFHIIQHSENNTTTLNSALTVLLNLAKASQKNTQQVFACLHSIEILTNLCKKNNPIAAELLDHLCQTNQPTATRRKLNSN